MLAALIFASLGIGFVLSLASEAESHAVQHAMIVLLASVIFSGFLLDLRSIWAPVQAVSWALPATYGIVLLRDIMLRRVPASPMLLAGLLGIGAAMFLLALVLLRRLMARA